MSILKHILHFFLFQKTPKSEGEKWLQTWSKKTTTVDADKIHSPKAKPGIAIGEIDAKSVTIF